MKETMELSKAIDEVINQGERLLQQSKTVLEDSKHKFEQVLASFENDYTRKEKGIRSKVRLLEKEHNSLQEEKARYGEDYSQAVAAGEESKVMKYENLLLQVDTKIKNCLGKIEYLRQYSIPGDQKLYEDVLKAYSSHDNLAKRSEKICYGQAKSLEESIRKVEELIEKLKDIRFYSQMDRQIVEVYEKYNGMILENGKEISKENKVKVIKSKLVTTV